MEGVTYVDDSGKDDGKKSNGMIILLVVIAVGAAIAFGLGG